MFLHPPLAGAGKRRRLHCQLCPNPRITLCPRSNRTRANASAQLQSTRALLCLSMWYSVIVAAGKVSASASAFSDSTGDALDQSVLERPMPCTTCKNCLRKDCGSCIACCSKRLRVDQDDHQGRVCELRRCLNPINAVSSPLMRPDINTMTRKTDTAYYGGSD